MELQQVRYFLAVASTLNFTRAAEQCNVTQPALTKGVQKLEQELGGELIYRERQLTQCDAVDLDVEVPRPGVPPSRQKTFKPSTSIVLDSIRVAPVSFTVAPSGIRRDRNRRRPRG
jgi:hypothetical protein